MHEWKKEECSSKPSEFQEIAPGVSILQRRNITEVNHEATDDTPAYTSWECESRKLTMAEYARYLAEDAAAKTEYIAMMNDIDFGEG